MNKQFTGNIYICMPYIYKEKYLFVYIKINISFMIKEM